LPLLEQKMKTLVCLPGSSEAGELPHRPQPSTVHGRVNTAGKWIMTRFTWLSIGPNTELIQVAFCVEGGDWDPANCGSRFSPIWDGGRGLGCLCCGLRTCHRDCFHPRREHEAGRAALN